jgi:predicted ester cyclase
MAGQREKNERVVRSLFETVINGQEYEAIDQYCSTDVRLHRPGDVIEEGIDAYEAHYRTLHTVFPDFEAALTHVVADHTAVATRFTASGTHDAELFGIPATGTTVQFNAQIVFRLDGETVVAEFHQSDRTHLREQLRQPES